MDKASLQLQREWTANRTKRINEEIERFKLQCKRLNTLIKDDENEITELQETLKKNTDDYLADKPYEAIEYFIKERGYTYSVEDVLEGYEQYKNRKYTSHTMSDCIKNLKKPLELIFNLKTTK